VRGGQTTVQHLAELEPLRRYATLTALVLELTATLTDEALNMFEHLVGQLFKKWSSFSNYIPPRQVSLFVAGMHFSRGTGCLDRSKSFNYRVGMPYALRDYPRITFFQQDKLTLQV
jgi:hypothetical protein